MALKGLVSLRWDRRSSLTLLTQELRWLSSDSLPTSTEWRATQSKQLFKTVTKMGVRRDVPCVRFSDPAGWGVNDSLKECYSSVTLCAAASVIKGYRHCPCPASIHSSDPFEELLGLYETQPPHHWCLPPSRTALGAAPLNTKQYIRYTKGVEWYAWWGYVTDHMTKRSRWTVACSWCTHSPGYSAGGW